MLFNSKFKNLKDFACTIKDLMNFSYNFLDSFKDLKNIQKPLKQTCKIIKYTLAFSRM